MSDSVLRVALTDGAGKPLNSFEIRLQEGLSLKLVKSVVNELLGNKLKAAVEAALPALGFK